MYKMSVRNKRIATLQRDVFEALEGDLDKTLYVLRPHVIPDVLLNKLPIAGGHYTPLTRAATLGNNEAVRVLLDYQNKHCGGDLASRSNTNTFAALLIAAKESNMVLGNTILETVGDVNGVNCAGETALHILCKISRDVMPAVRLLYCRGAKLDIADAKGATCLFNACKKAREDVVEYLLALGADPNHRTLSLATPLHAATARGDYGVARLLFQYGARVSQDEHGYSPLLWAALRSSIKCLEYFLTLTRFSRKEKIDALELLGAVVFCCAHRKSYAYLKRAMDERYKDPTDIILKPQRPPVADLGSVVESQTPQELESRQHDWHKLGLEGLLVMERIFGEDNKYVMTYCSNFCWALAQKQSNEEAFAVWKYTRRHSLFHMELSCLSTHVCRIFTSMQSEGFPPKFLHYHDALRLTVQEMEVQARAAEEGKKYPRSITCNTKPCVSFIRRALALASSDSDINQLEDVTRRFIIAAAHFPTLPVLHLAWVAVLHIDLVEDPEITATYEPYVAFLAKCGADVSGKDKDKDTPLHRICGCKRRDQNFQKFACSVARIFLELGADVDARNGKNQIPLDVAWSEDMRAVLLQHYPLSLKCLAASAIVQNGIPYECQVPSSVESFIRIHDSS